MARFTATEMVGAALTSVEAKRLLALLGDVVGADDERLRDKLTVLVQVAEATERRQTSEAADVAAGVLKPRSRRR